MIESDTDRLDMLDDWNSVVYKGKTFSGILENAYVEAGGIETLKPTVLVRVSDVTGAQRGDSISIDGASYTIEGEQPDGTGYVLLILKT